MTSPLEKEKTGHPDVPGKGFISWFKKEVKILTKSMFRVMVEAMSEPYLR